MATQWLTVGLMVGLGGGAGLLSVFNGLTAKQALGDFFVAPVGVGLSFCLLSVVISLKRPELRISGLFRAVGLANLVSPFAAQYGRYALLTHPGGLPAGHPAAWVAAWTWPAGFALLLVGVPLLFPDGRVPEGGWRFVPWMAVIASAAMMLANAVIPAANPGLPEVPNRYGIRSIGPAATVVSHLATILLLVATLGAVASLVGRYRRSADPEKEQLRWLLLTTALLALVVSVSIGASSAQSYGAAAIGPGIAIAIGVAILRHKLYDLDLVINRSLVYLTLSGIVIGVYVLVVGYLGSRINAHGTTTGIIAAGIIALLFHPARQWVQRGVNRLLYGQRDEPYAVLTALGRRLEANVSPDEVLGAIASTVQEALRVPYARVELLGVPDRAEVGVPCEIAIRLPLMSGAEQVGALAVAGRHPGEALGSRDRTLLADFARQAGVAAHGVLLTARLKSARERLVGAREEERLRLRRDLHDGLGPQLASQALMLDAARNLLPADPPAVDGLLVDLRRQTQDAVAEIRRIVYDLRPPALDAHGLEEALREHAGRLIASGLRILVDCPIALPVLAPAVEVAAYRIATEAVTNAARHSGASHCWVSLSVEARHLRLCVSEDGAGFGPQKREGMGLASMRERAAELGGTCLIEGGPGQGVRVVAMIPLAGGSP